MCSGRADIRLVSDSGVLAHELDEELPRNTIVQLPKDPRHHQFQLRLTQNPQSVRHTVEDLLLQIAGAEDLVSGRTQPGMKVEAKAVHVL